MRLFRALPSFFIAPLFCIALVLNALSPVGAIAQPQAASHEDIVIDAHAPAHPFPHYWEGMFGSGRAVLSLRESYRNDLRSVKSVIDFRYVRFHAVFHDEMGVYDEDAQGNPVYNFNYVDQVYDGLLANGVRPFVELSFTPYKLASSKTAIHPFWYKQNVSPPRDWAKWDALVEAFARHLVDRYGIEEVAQWYFEVWNEPNIDFWAGDPKEPTYYELYDHSAHALKHVNVRLRVGGPATAQAAWVDRFLSHCAGQKVPVDFVSTHVYGNDTADNVLGHSEAVPPNGMVVPAIRKVHQQIKASAFPNLPFFMSEFNATYANEPLITDTAFMGPWLADTIRQVDGLIDQMSYWSFSDVFEEQGVVKQPFYGGYGLMAAGSIPKPAYNAFALLHQLGDSRLDAKSDSVIATRAKDGSLAIALWNYAPPGKDGPQKDVDLHVQGVPNNARVTVSRVDETHGNVLVTYKQMGQPASPTQKQLTELREAARLPAPEVLHLQNGTLHLPLPSHALFLIEVSSK